MFTHLMQDLSLLNFRLERYFIFEIRQVVFRKFHEIADEF